MSQAKHSEQVVTCTLRRVQATCHKHSLSLSIKHLGQPGNALESAYLTSCSGALRSLPAGCRRHSLLGVRFWASQRLLDTAMRRAAAPLQGTWAMRAYLRALGAKIGAWATFRMTNVLLAPDMLVVGPGAHVGDAANLVASYAADADTVVVGRVELGQQARVPALFRHLVLRFRPGDCSRCMLVECELGECAKAGRMRKSRYCGVPLRPGSVPLPVAQLRLSTRELSVHCAALPTSSADGARALRAGHAGHPGDDDAGQPPGRGRGAGRDRAGGRWAEPGGRHAAHGRARRSRCPSRTQAPIITPLGAAQHALFWAMPALQAAAILLGQAATVLAAGCAADGLLAALVRITRVTHKSRNCLQLGTWF